MKLETLAKIGIITGIILAIIVSAGYVIMILNHEFDMEFSNQFRIISDERKEKIVNELLELQVAKIFIELYPNYLIDTRYSNYEVRITLVQYEPSTENALTLELNKNYDESDDPYMHAHCDTMKRKSGERRDASGIIAIEFIKNTDCVKPVQ